MNCSFVLTLKKAYVIRSTIDYSVNQNIVHSCLNLIKNDIIFCSNLSTQPFIAPLINDYDKLIEQIHH